MKLVSRAKPEDLDLAVPPLPGGRSDMTLREIASGWANWPTKGARSYERAVNVEYRDGPNGACVSLLSSNGIIWMGGRYPQWPMFAVTHDNRALILSATDLGLARQARFAFSAGPYLVRGGQLCNTADEIRKGDYSGLCEATPRQRAAIGITQDGFVVHVATDRATLDEMATIMRQEGCVDAINLDGGDSVGVVDSAGRVLIGYSLRQVCSALIFKRLIEQESTYKMQSLVPVDTGYHLLFHYSEKPVGQASKNFRWSEFASKRTGRVFIAVYLIELCQYIRDAVGGPVRINSAYRDAVHNQAVGGSPDSYHVYGLAIDLDATRYGVDRLIKIARDFGWRGGLGRYRSFVHFDLGPERVWYG